MGNYPVRHIVPSIGIIPEAWAGRTMLMVIWKQTLNLPLRRPNWQPLLYQRSDSAEGTSGGMVTPTSTTATSQFSPCTALEKPWVTAILACARLIHRQPASTNVAGRADNAEVPLVVIGETRTMDCTETLKPRRIKPSPAAGNPKPYRQTEWSHMNVLDASRLSLSVV